MGKNIPSKIPKAPIIKKIGMGWIMKVVPRSKKVVIIVVDNIKTSSWLISIILLEMRLPKNSPVKIIVKIQAEISGFKPM